MMPRVSKEHKEHRRQSILDGAMKVFISKGYQLATIDDISTECGLSVGAIYRYFHTKSEILLTLVEERLGRTPELFDRLTETAGTPLERLERCVELFTQALRVRHPATGRLLLVTLAEAVQDGNVRRGLLQRFSSLVAYLKGVVQDGITQGLFRPEIDATSLAALLLCTADGVAVYWVTNAPDFDLRAMRRAQLDMIRSYVLQKG